MNILLILGIFSNIFKNNVIDYSYLDSQIEISTSIFKEEYDEYQRLNYFNGEKKDDIANKIERYLNSNLDGKGFLITDYSLSVGMDPYLASSVMLLETGCYWNCSKLVRNCNNVGGNKGKPGCNGGSYRRFESLDEGIKFAIDKLNRYYQKGLTTPKQINPHYAESKEWYIKVENYMKKLKKD